MKLIFVIYGLPRTGTTFLFDRFVDAGCYGTKAREMDNKYARYSTCEPATLSRLAAKRKHVGYSTNNYMKRIYQSLDLVFKFNATDKPYIVLKHPFFSVIGDIVQEYFVKRGYIALWINTRRNLEDVIASADAQGELMADLMFNKRNCLEDDYKKDFPAFFGGDIEVLPMTPEERSVFLFKRLQVYESYVSSIVEPMIFDYDSDQSPELFDIVIKNLFNMNLRLAENWKTGNGRKHDTRLDMGCVKELLEEKNDYRKE